MLSIALFRGLNVGGRNVLPMKDLLAILESLGYEDVRTYIQSGNAVFRHPHGGGDRFATEIREAIRASRGFAPEVLVLTANELQRAMSANPFPGGEAEPSRLHLYFLAGKPRKPDFELVERLRAKSERFELNGEIAYLHAPEGIGRSKLAAGLERALGVSATARNWRTVSKILGMVQSIEPG